MTGYEKIRRVLDGEAIGEIPIMLHNFMQAAKECGYTMREYRENADAITRSHIDTARRYGLDGILVDIDTCMEAYAVGVPVDFPEDEPARVTGPASGQIEFLIEAMDPERLVKNDRIKILMEAIHLIKREVKGELFLRGNCDQMAFSLAMLSYGMEDFMADLLDEDCEEGIFRLMDRAYEVHLTFHKMMNEAGADMTSFGDSSCGPDLISREMYRKYAMPYHKRLQKDLSALGIQSLCHICGNTDRIIEDVAGVGFDAVEIDYKTDVSKAAEALKGKSVMFGPIDPSGMFYFGTPEAIAAETRRVLDIFKGEGLVIGAGCALPATTPEHHIRAFVEAVRNYKV